MRTPHSSITDGGGSRAPKSRWFSTFAPDSERQAPQRDEDAPVLVTLRGHA
jgi:hypothetical protein